MAALLGRERLRTKPPLPTWIDADDKSPAKHPDREPMLPTDRKDEDQKP